MAKAKFSEDFRFTPKVNERVSKMYKANVEYTDCTRDCIEQAKAKGILIDGKGSKKVQRKNEENTEASPQGGTEAN